MKSKSIIQRIKSKLVLIVGVVAGLIFAAIFLYRMPAAGEIAAAARDGEAEIEQMHRNNRSASTLDEDTATIDGYWEKSQEAFFDPVAKASNLAYFYEAGARCSVNVTKVEQRNLSDAKNEDPFTPVLFYISMNGDFASIMRFINTLREEHFLMRIEKCFIKPANTATPQENADLVIGFQTYTPKN